jgi:surface protein
MFCGYGDETTKFPFDGDISRWDVSNVTNMTGMFSFSKFNGNISKWNVSNVQFMKAMFACSSFSGDISEWDTSKVTNMDYMFKNSAIKALGKIPAWYKESENANLFKNGWGNSSRERDRIYEKDIFVMLQNPADDR